MRPIEECWEWKDGVTKEQHLKRMKGLTDKLNAIHAPTSEEDQDLKRNERNANEPNSASVSDFTSVSRKQPRTRKPIICYNCNKPDHKSPECSNKRRQNAHSLWLIDSGASSHKTLNRESFDSYKKLEHTEIVSLGDGRIVEAVAIGVVKVMLKLNRRVQAAF
ncbi:uncharacterized protein [Watersipora subatra]|uniref:uncharacterized protein n=1 Tax=Watersipora subatra TaxID=2589382 RepID=UPI00355C3AFA